MHRDDPDLLVGTRHQCPLIAGIGDGETLPGLLDHRLLRATRRVIYLEDGEIVARRATASRVVGARRGAASSATPIVVPWDDEIAEKRGYESFMLKEIHEQPRRGRGHDRGATSRDGAARPRAPRRCDVATSGAS